MKKTVRFTLQLAGTYLIIIAVAFFIVPIYNGWWSDNDVFQWAMTAVLLFAVSIPLWIGAANEGIRDCMHDEIVEKNVAFIIKGGKLTAKLLAKAMKAFLDGTGKLAKDLTTPKNMSGKGKQTVKQLTGQGAGVSNIEITDKNIKAFEGVARKYGVDFALRKDVSEVPPRWLVFFKSRDADALTAAFKEFSAKQLKKTAEKPSITENLHKMKAKVKAPVIDKTKHKSKGREL